MSDTLDADGLHLKTLSTLVSELEEDFQDIYGDDINLDSNSPDGQIINIFAQAGIDLREILEKINAAFDPDQAEGSVLDQRVGINGITRNQGTFTTVDIEMVIDRALNLVGLDEESAEIDPDVSDLYTVRDDAGTEFYLVDSQVVASAGTYTYEFRAADLGDVSITENTITTPVTVLAGVTSVNNPAGAVVQGEDEESDSALKIRRAKSTAISSTGYLDAIQAAIENVDSVVTAVVEENDTDLTDAYGTDPHSIWVIVDGGADADIAEVIYAKRCAGVGMRGDEEVDVTRANGGTFTAKFDRPINTSLYISFSIKLPNGVVDTDYLKESIVEDVVWGMGDSAVGSTITAYLLSINSSYQISSMLVSDDDSTYVEVLDPDTPQYRYINDTTRITITTV